MLGLRLMFGYDTLFSEHVLSLIVTIVSTKLLCGWCGAQVVARFSADVISDRPILAPVQPGRIVVSSADVQQVLGSEMTLEEDPLQRHFQSSLLDNVSLHT